MLFERVDRELSPMRERYEALINDPGKIEAILLAGAHKARALSAPFAARLRQAVGLRDLRQSSAPKVARAAKAALPSFKQYREPDGKFYVKMVDGQGHVLLQSMGFTSPQEAGGVVPHLVSGPGAVEGFIQTEAVALGEGVTLSDVQRAIQLLQAVD